MTTSLMAYALPTLSISKAFQCPQMMSSPGLLRVWDDDPDLPAKLALQVFAKSVDVRRRRAGWSIVVLHEEEAQLGLL